MDGKLLCVLLVLMLAASIIAATAWEVMKFVFIVTIFLHILSALPAFLVLGIGLAMILALSATALAAVAR